MKRRKLKLKDYSENKDAELDKKAKHQKTKQKKKRYS